MMRAAILGAVAAFLIMFGQVSADPPPVDPNQPRQDIFECGAGCNLQDYNPLTQKAKATRSVTYRLLVVQGCNPGLIVSDMQKIEAIVRADYGLTLIRNDASGDFPVYLSCGQTQRTACGSVYVFCLPNRFPENQDVYISDVMYTPGYVWYEDSRLSVLCHEICGHAISTWNEQYARCAASCGFASSPGWRDFMNTGPDSRHTSGSVECGRFMRTMWQDIPCAQTYGLAPPPPLSPWGECDGRYGNCWLLRPAWVWPDGGVYDVETGLPWPIPSRQ